jgi:RIO kinase 1
VSFVEVEMDPDIDLAVREEDPLAALEATGVITEVIGALRSGKEATVYVCHADRKKAGADLVAAKLYHRRERRDFRNAAVYDDGRQFLEERVARAVRSKTGFGREAEFGRWIGREWERLNQLHSAGVAVPRPIAVSDGVIVMQYLGNEEGAAPQLKDVSLSSAQATSAFRWLMYDVELMLGANVVHGDLSPYNILWWRDRATIIDLPQAVDPRFNRSARMLLERDIANVCKYFAGVVAASQPQRLSTDLWRRFMRAEL